MILTHEFAHARDHLVDGSIDGIFADIDANTFDNAIEASKERVNNGSAEGLFNADYASTNDQEFLAEMFEGYYLDPVLFKERFPEFTEALGETFDHLDEVISLLDFNEEAKSEIFDTYRNM
ncbi:MAG: zinc-dependent peptidase [Candidatus Caenarcaniphilales bacterium]|nr:zinc-dependent peptidase [Candidatus Caenarcaniphilales bacterium]